MPMATLGWHDVKLLNSKFFTTVKSIVGLSRHTPNMHVMRTKKELGMEVAGPTTADPSGHTPTDSGTPAELLGRHREDVCGEESGSATK